MPLLTLLETVAAVRRGGAPAGLAVVDVRLVGGQMTPLHAHDEDEALTVLSGTITVYAAGEVVRLAAGDAYLVRAGVPHAHHADAGAVRYLTAAFARSAARYEDFVRAVGHPGGLGSSAAGLDAVAAAVGTVVLGAPGELPGGLARPAA